MDDLHVDGQLAAAVIEDEDADGAAAALKGRVEARPEVGLVNDGKVGLDVAGLGHGDDAAVGHVEDAVLLEDGAEHGLDDNAGLGVGDEGRLLVELLGEEVDAEVAVLAGGGRGGDADDLAGAALQHQEVAEADVVAGDGHRVGQEGALPGGRALVAAVGAAGLAGLTLDVDVLLAAVFVVVTHLGLDTVAEAFAGALNGLFGDLGVLELGTLEGGTTVDGVLGLDVGAGRLLAAHFLAVGTGLESLAVLALDAVDGGVVVVVVTVNLDERLGVLLTLWLLELRLGLVLGAVFLVVVRLLVELARATRTVAFLDADLLFSVVLLLLLGARARRLLRGRGTGD